MLENIVDQFFLDRVHAGATYSTVNRIVVVVVETVI